MATDEIVDATETRRLIKAGTICRFRGFDHDGDVLLTYESAGRRVSTVIYIADLHHLSLE